VEAKVVAELDACELLVTPQRPHPRNPSYEDLIHLTFLKDVLKVPIPLPSAGVTLAAAKVYPSLAKEQRGKSGLSQPTAAGVRNLRMASKGKALWKGG
jgi:hypothetical protein